MALLSVGGVGLPSPTSLQIDDEIIWSSDSGRDLSGLFAGDVVTSKKTITVGWEFLTEKEVALLQSKLIAGYFPVTFRDGGEVLTIETYRGTLSKVALGYIGDDIFYYKAVSCKIVQR